MIKKGRVLPFFAVLFMLANLSWAESQGRFPADSLYNAQLSWLDETGKKVELSSWAGKNVIITMAYSSCKSACPLTFSRLKKLQAILNEKKKTAEFVIVSLDPKNDTPERMSEFKHEQKLSEENWHFLHGSDQEVRKFSMLAGISYQENQNTKEIMHSNKLLLLGPDGAIVKELEGLNSDVGLLVEAIP